ncbi:MAG: hypothetical protein V1495_00150 [Pseudomonadota bacterium]
MLTATSTDQCGFTLNLFANLPSSVGCYGPGIYYEHEPVSDTTASSGGGDSGIWDEIDGQSGNACVAAQTNMLVGQVSRLVDTAVNSFASMVCVINASGLTIPAAEGGALDLASTLQTVLTTNGIDGITISTASLDHQASTSDGHDVYFFTLTGTMTKNGDTREVTLYLKHIPLDADNTTYKGKLSFAFGNANSSESGNCNDANTVGAGNKTTSMVDAGSVLYSKDSATNLTYRFQYGTFCDSTHMPLAPTNHDIDPTDTASPSNPTGYANGFKYYLFNVNPADGTGSFAFAWAAGTGSENARTLEVSLGALSGGGTGGCGYFGYGPPVKDGSTTPGNSLGDITGFVCNWSMPGPTKPNHPWAQRQCVKLDTASGHYLTDATQGALAITYAPTDTCDSLADADFVYYSTISSAENPAINDLRTPGDVIHNLIDVKEDKIFTLPTVPADVY